MNHCTPDASGHCTLCGDDAVEAMVIAVDSAARLATARVGGAIAIVALDLVDGVAEGDVVLVHQGFAIGRLDRRAEEAR
ncbi:MAG: HypC/HybG/HupF family hydrogenase formation chaperone [Gemmatimonadota bacterium]|nr:HypC/HybG/HupF family hydrogenase formation chaperone [Gemmatimonadota bacterium]